MRAVRRGMFLQLSDGVYNRETGWQSLIVETLEQHEGVSDSAGFFGVVGGCLSRARGLWSTRKYLGI